MRRFAYGAALAWLFSLATWQPAAAINLVWDDSGDDASKEWSITGNWDPDNLPDTTDDLFIGVDAVGANVANAANDVTIVDQDFNVQSITLGNGADIVNSTDSGTTTTEIQVDAGVTVGNGTGTSIIILYDANEPAESLDANTVTINGGGEVRLDSDNAAGDLAILQVDNGLLDLNTGGTISGNGRIRLADTPGAPTSLFELDGTLTARAVSLLVDPLPTTLQITATSADARINLDGASGNGTVNVNRNATLDIDVPLGDGFFGFTFNGTINLQEGATLDIAEPWDFDGAMDVNTPSVLGGAGDAARLAGGAIAMEGGTITLADGLDSLTLDVELSTSGGVIENSGLITFNSVSLIGALTDLNMNGGNASLTVNSTLNILQADFDLDGIDAAGNITTINDDGILDLELGVGADVNFGHTININGGRLDVSSSAVTSWSLNSLGTINAAGGTGSAILSSGGDTFNISGAINVTDEATLTINLSTSNSVFNSTAEVVIDAGSQLSMGTTTYNGGSYSGAGVFLKGTATIAAATTWNVATVDLEHGATTLNANLTVNAEKVELSTDGVDETLTISDAAQLAVNINGGGSWELNSVGAIVYNGNATANTYLAGSDILMNGTINHTGDGAIDARLEIGSTGVININTAGEPLRLSGGNSTTNPNTIAGGTISGAGLLGADNLTALVGFGTINATVDFDDTSHLLADDGTLNVNTIVDVSTLGTADDDGVLNVIPAWNTNVSQSVDLNGGTLQGGAITNGGANGINGHGLITASIINNTRIDAEGGDTLTLENQVPGNLDGAGTGSLNAISSNLTVVFPPNTVVNFAGTVRADAGQQFTDNFTLWTFLAGSTLDLNGGTFRSNRGTVLNGTVDVAAGADSTISNPNLARFGSTSSTTLNGNLRLVGAPEIHAGATFAGGESLINTAMSTLTLADGADVDVLLQNEGTLVLGTSPGQTQGLDFQQTATGRWDVELGGTGLNDYDRMTLTGLAAVDGTLNLSLINGYVPTLADPLLTILSANSVIGTFDVVIQPATMPAGLRFNVVYNAANVQVVVAAALLGDYNQNGQVETSDYVVWRSTLGDVVAPFTGADGDGDGMIDDDDYDVWTAHYGETSGSGSAVGQSVAVPERGTTILALLAIVGGLIFGGRKPCRRWAPGSVL